MLELIKKRFDFNESDLMKLKKYKNIKLLVMRDCKDIKINAKNKILELIKKMKFVSKNSRMKKNTDLNKFKIKTKWEKLKQLLRRN